MKNLTSLTKLTITLASLIPFTTAITNSLPTKTLIDTKGRLNKSSIPNIAPDTPVVTLLTSPGTPSLFETTSGGVHLTTTSKYVLLTSPGATLESSDVSDGIGAATSGAVSDVVILSGVTSADVEVGLKKTRHGRTLGELFAARMKGGGGVGKLIVVVEGGDEVDVDGVVEDVECIFESVAVASSKGSGAGELGDYFEVRVEMVKSKEDAARILEEQTSTSSTKKPSHENFSTHFTNIYNTILQSQTCDPTPVAEAILAFNDAYSRASRMSRAKIATWKHRASRGLLVDKFGHHADSLLSRTLDLFDRDTMGAAGLPRAAEKRLEIRNILEERTTKMIKELYASQLLILEKSTLKKFNNALLRSMNSNKQDNTEATAAILQNALSSYEKSATMLQVTSLSLTKSKPLAEITNKLTTALTTFTDSPSAKLSATNKLSRTVSKQRKPSEASINLAFDLVAMIRPDGYGNLQGFAGYQLGPHGVTVGVCNDADDPQVISGFGGVRPPFLRVQPKVKVDVEL